VADPKDDSQAARDERAAQLRKEIADRASGKPETPGRKKSIREQVEDASRKLVEDGEGEDPREGEDEGI
jgi:hypothetical protein